ncbi:hypothetical protein ACFQ2H_08875 [Streptomyces violaceoruber]
MGIGAATVDVVADGAGWLRFSTEGPGDGRHRWQFVLRHQPSDGNRRPDVPVRTSRTNLDNGGTRYTAALGPRPWTNSATAAGR